MSKHKSSESSLLTLQQLAQDPQNKAKSVGIILDATRPYRTANSKDFITKLKIIDDTLNFEKNDSKLKNPFIQIFLFTKKIEDAPIITRLGDIIYLKRYDFSYYQEGELKAIKNNVSNGHTYVFEGGNCENFQIVQSDNSNQNKNVYEPNQELQIRIKQLRKFGIEYFSKYSITQMAWYGLQLNTDILKKQDFDMILKIVDKKSSINLGHENQIENEDEENSQNQYIKRFQFQDGAKNNFYLNYLDFKEFQIGSLVKIRSIQLVNQEQELKVSNYTSICLIPEYFIDFSNFEYYIYELITEQNQANTIKQGIQESQQGLNEFDTENNDKNCLTYIKRKYKEDANFNTTTDLIDLIKIQNTYSQDQKIKYENQKYKVNCYVIDIQPQKIQDSLLYLCKNCKVTHEYQQGNEAVCCGKVCQLIQEICFIVKDKSIDTDPLVFELYVYPYDSNPSELFPGINLRNLNNDQNSLEIYNFIYNNYIDELFNKSGLIQYLEFIIQPMFYKNTMIFRIVDSQIKKIDFKDN